MESMWTVWIWLMAFPSVGSVRVAITSQAVSRADHEQPPLEGCGANFWHKTCCCFVDFGILKQRKCECSDGARSCEKKVHLTYGAKPSRPIGAEATANPLWFSDDGSNKGFLKGYQAVDAKFCSAAAIHGPQIDGRERAFECTCTTAMGQSVNMECGSGCDVTNCKRWNPDGKFGPIKLDWSPFESGRGKCCLSSFESSKNGCPQQVANVTDNHAKSIVIDAVAHAKRRHDSAFLLRTSQSLVPEMTQSFSTVKGKKMQTSRSGAQFFISGDNSYILKSIHRSEYEVLKTLTHPTKAGNIPLIDHLEDKQKIGERLSEVGNCIVMDVQHHDPILRNSPQNTPARRLSKAVSQEFYGSWFYDRRLAMASGSPVYRHSHYEAFYCKSIGAWRIQTGGLFNDEVTPCDNRTYDAFLKVIKHLRKYEHSDEDVEMVYNDLLAAFSKKQQEETTIGNIKCQCRNYWWPASLINTFMLAFTYHSSTWMVIKNSVTSVSQALEHHGFTNFYQDSDLFDVKPLPIHSDERPLLFGMHFVKAHMSTWRGWNSVRSNLYRDVMFLDHALANPMVDYSLLVNAYYINDERMALDHIPFPNCVESPLSSISTIRIGSDYGPAKGSILVCFTIIDMLMELTAAKTPENLVLFKKWSDWSDKMMHMFDCLGSSTSKACKHYFAMHQRYVGVDIPSIETARVKDVTESFDAEGRAIVYQHAAKTVKIFKCCCHPIKGLCKIVDVTGKKQGMFGNLAGCGSAAGKGWHSFLRKASRCKVYRDDAAQLDTSVNMSSWA